MRKLITLLFLSICITCGAQPSFVYQRDFKAMLDSTKDNSNTVYYGKLLERFKNNDSSLSRREVLYLMIGFTEDNHYDPYNDMITEKQIFDLNESGDYTEALLESRDYIKDHPLSLRILKERSFSYNQVGKRDSAKYFMALVDKIMSAMIYSGKGRSAEEPIFSLGLDDGEQFIPNVGMTITNKTTGRNKSKLFLEIINARTEENVSLDYFFVIQHAKEKMDGNDIKEVPVKKRKSKLKEARSR